MDNQREAWAEWEKRTAKNWDVEIAWLVWCLILCPAILIWVWAA